MGWIEGMTKRKLHEWNGNKKKKIWTVRSRPVPSTLGKGRRAPRCNSHGETFVCSLPPEVRLSFNLSPSVFLSFSLSLTLSPTQKMCVMSLCVSLTHSVVLSLCVCHSVSLSLSYSLIFFIHHVYCSAFPSASHSLSLSVIRFVSLGLSFV